jgi:anti-anti-sigma regulatory factor
MYRRELGTNCEVILRFTETFDAAAARDVGPSLRRVPSDQGIVLDFTQTHDVDYYGLSVLAGEISQSPAHVSLRGLSHRHVRMLRYFGLDPASFGINDSRFG